MNHTKKIKKWSAPGLTALFAGALPAAGDSIHDADHDILKARHGGQWAKDDQAVVKAFLI